MTPDIREKAERLHDSLSFHYTTTKADRVNIISQALLEAHKAGREEERERLFDALIAQYEGWNAGPGADEKGAIALSLAIFMLFPEQAKAYRASAIRSLP